MMNHPFHPLVILRTPNNVSSNHIYSYYYFNLYISSLKITTGELSNVGRVYTHVFICFCRVTYTNIYFKYGTPLIIEGLKVLLEVILSAHPINPSNNQLMTEINLRVGTYGHKFDPGELI